MLQLIAYVLLAALASWVFVTGWFFALAKASELKEHKDEFGWVVVYPLYVFLATGAVADVVFNATWGTAIFRELPREWFFTKRVRRHLKGGTWRAREARVWADRMNRVLPGHA